MQITPTAHAFACSPSSKSSRARLLHNSEEKAFLPNIKYSSGLLLSCSGILCSTIRMNSAPQESQLKAAALKKVETKTGGGGPSAEEIASYGKVVQGLAIVVLTLANQ